MPELDWTDILQKIEEGEGEAVELKRGPGDLSDVGKAICALANTRGGLLILGVTDEQRIVGVKENPEKLYERLTSFLHTGCSSPVTARIGRHKDPIGWIFWIDVPRQRGFEPLRYNKQVWVRRARSSVEPSPSELQDLLNVFGYILTEEQTIQGANVKDIDLDAFRSYLERMGLEVWDGPQPEPVVDLRNRGVVSEIGGVLTPTLYGVLHFGKDPQIYSQTRNFVVDCIAYGGNDRNSEVLFVSQAAGRLSDQVKRAIGWFSSLGRFELYHDLVREDRPLLPPAALRESLVNAVVHRDYAITGSKVLLEAFAQCVDVTSPGGLPNHMEVGSVQAGGLPRSRNESIAHCMFALGFMESRGRGWPIMRNAMREFNGTEPELMQGNAREHVRVRFHFEDFK